MFFFTTDSISAPVKDEFFERKQYTRKFATQILKETQTFLENHVEMEGAINPTRPRLPIFFVKSYNFLQKQAKEINYEDKYLNFLPNGIMMQLLTEFGPSDDFPKFEADGTLEDKQQSLELDILQFYADVQEYVTGVQVCTGTIPPLPVAYHMTLSTFQCRASSEEEETMANDIPGKVQDYLTRIMGSDIGEDYVVQCTKQHYEAFKDH